MRWQRGSVTVEGARGQRRYVGRYRRDDGTQPKVPLGFVSEISLTEARTKLEAHVREQGSRPQSSLTMTFSDYWTLHYEPRRKVRWSDATAAGYKAYLACYITPAFGNVRLADITPELVSAFFERIRDHERSVVTKNWTMLNAVLEEAVDDDIISKSPMRRLSRPKTRLPKKPVMEAVFLKKVLKAGKPDPFDSALLHVGTFCTLRTSEMLGLHWRSFCGDHFVIRDVAWEGEVYEDQTKNKERSVFIPPGTRAALKRWRKVAKYTGPDDMIFASEVGTPMSAHNIRNRIMVPLREKLKLPVPLTFQVLRRSFATRQQEHLKSVQSHLGHSSPGTTAGIYMQAIPAAVRQLVSKDERQILSGER
jgi:integrase